MKAKSQSIKHKLEKMIEETPNDAYEVKESLGYINRDKVVKTFYLKLFIFALIVLFFLANIAASVWRISTVPDSKYYMTTMSGHLYNLKPVEVDKGKLRALKKKFEVENGIKQN